MCIRDRVYLDNAATTQKPMSVIMSMTAYYERTNANVHRGVHTLSQEATSLMEESRARICLLYTSSLWLSQDLA